MKTLSILLSLSLLLTACTPAASEEALITEPMTDQTTDAELQINDTVVGTGAEAKKGDTLVVHYTGTLEDGTKFDSSVDRGAPFEFQIGQGYVIEGWEKGMLGMKVGGKRTLTIPSDMAYGDSGIPGAIPGGATLIFEVELLEIK